MNKKEITAASSSKDKILELKVLAKEKESVRGKLEVTAKKLAVLAKEKENVRGKLEITAKQLAKIAKGKEGVRGKLAVTAENLRGKAKHLAEIAKEKESVRGKLEVTAKQLAILAKEKEEVRGKLEITAKQLAVTAIETESANKKLRTLLESIGDGVIVIDRNWNITEWNKAASNIAGWNKEEVLNKPFRSIMKLIRERDRKENLTFIEDAMVSGKTRNMENHTILVKKNGEEVSVGDSCAPIFDASSKVIGAIIIFRDLTKEYEFLQLHSDFSYASHQLNTPVNKALWILESALDQNDVSAMKDRVLVAYESIQSTLKLVGQLGIVSEIDQKTVIPQYENVRLVDTIDEVKKSLEKLIKRSGITLDIEAISGVMGINTDHKMLNKILFEIIENSILYSKTNGKMNIITKIQDNNLLFEIADDGIGITEEQQVLIFTKFFRGSNFDTTKIAGSGLGLFIAREYAKLLKGKIWFKSAKDTGTTFFVSIPLA